MMLAIMLALAAAAVYGTATALQHHAASGEHRPDGSSRHLLARLWRQPTWLLGLGLSGVAFALHVAALHEGPLTVVQPIVVTTVVFAVLVRAGLDRTPPIPAEILWCVCTWVGLALFVAAVGPDRPHPVAEDQTSLPFLAAGAAVAALAAIIASRTASRARRGFLLGVAAGILYGLTAALIKVSTSHGTDPLSRAPDRPLVDLAHRADGAECVLPQPVGLRSDPAVGQRPHAEHRRRGDGVAVQLRRVR